MGVFSQYHLAQFKSPLILILMGAVILSFFLREPVDAVIIIAIILLIDFLMPESGMLPKACAKTRIPGSDPADCRAKTQAFNGIPVAVREARKF